MNFTEAKRVSNLASDRLARGISSISRNQMIYSTRVTLSESRKFTRASPTALFLVVHWHWRV